MDPFDLARLRKNWDRAPEPPAPSASGSGMARAAAASRRGDPYVEGKALIGQVRTLALASYAAHREALVPFLDRADALIESMAAEPSGDVVALREELLLTLVDLEDLFDVFGATAK